jgi:hypothetical protein
MARGASIVADADAKQVTSTVTNATRTNDRRASMLLGFFTTLSNLTEGHKYPGLMHS